MADYEVTDSIIYYIRIYLISINPSQLVMHITVALYCTEFFTLVALTTNNGRIYCKATESFNVVGWMSM